MLKRPMVTFFCVLSLLLSSSVQAQLFDDRDLDGKDLALFLSAYGAQASDPNFHPECDFAKDGDVDELDLGALASWFGKDVLVPPDQVAEVGVQGGQVEVPQGTSPIQGVKIVIPPGAVESPAMVHIMQVTQAPPCPLELEPTHPVVSLHMTRPFSGKLEIRFPMQVMADRSEKIPGAFYFDEAAQDWRLILPRNYDADSIIIETDHLSLWGWGYVNHSRIGHDRSRAALEAVLGTQVWDQVETAIAQHVGRFRELGEEIANQAGCAVLDGLSDGFEAHVDSAMDVLDGFYGGPSAHCSDLFLMGDCNWLMDYFTDPISQKVVSKIEETGVLGIAAILKVGTTASIHQLVNGIFSKALLVAMTPCNLCYAAHSGFNPAFWVELAQYHAGVWGMEVADAGLEAFNCWGGDCDLPAPQSPVSEVQYEDGLPKWARLSWSPVDGAHHYHLRISNSSNPVFLTYSSSSPGGQGQCPGDALQDHPSCIERWADQTLFYEPIGEVPHGTYHWAVAPACDNGARGEWSPIDSFGF